jgi:NADH-quinone oxidoreductase subunit H
MKMALGFIMLLPVLLGAMISAALLVWWERRLLGFWQDRLGPNRVGPFGILQIVADVVKLFADRLSPVDP